MSAYMYTPTTVSSIRLHCLTETKRRQQTTCRWIPDFLRLNSLNANMTLEAVQEQYGNMTVIPAVEEVGTVCGFAGTAVGCTYVCATNLIDARLPSINHRTHVHHTLGQYGKGVYKDRIAALREQCHVIIKVNNDVRAPPNQSIHTRKLSFLSHLPPCVRTNTETIHTSRTASTAGSAIMQRSRASTTSCTTS